ncbi:HAMP domain-containing sensor histidine kinase [uncultured Desulfovibrio sp.]|uniref:sensor histidine kinase n=1 Tax=uncultured Desulfovibrio sp. TaxID=167968 RepID=UPI002605E8CF|nr:HAMP domain-containing sensor histidine kinase [uncultured Desulfovibrio sp.]
MRLYTKFMVWAVLNLVWIAIVLTLCIAWFFLGKGGLFSPIFFQGGITQTMQTVVTNMQYKPIYEWRHVLDASELTYGVRFYIAPLDCGTNIPGGGHIPQSVLETASLLPTPQISLCPDAITGEQPVMEAHPTAGSGFLPVESAVYMHVDGLYWFGRTVLVPDENHRLHYLFLVASSDSFSGNGQYFNFSFVVIVCIAVMVLSFLWWWPFVLHLTRPMAKLTQTAERIASGENIPNGKNEVETFALPRSDEIGRLSLAVDSMASQIMQKVWGQRRFIRYIAHELGSPIARTKFGLAVLEAHAEGEDHTRVQRIIKDVECLSEMIEDVLTFLRSEGLPEKAKIEEFSLEKVLKGIIEVEGQNTHVSLRMEDPGFMLHSDIECVRRAVGNTLRNAVRYAGQNGPVVVDVVSAKDGVVISVLDSGPGVPQSEHAHLTEPFFRADEGKKHPGGSGLGLSIVRHCIDICNGSLTFSNRDPHGFCVAMFFPQASLAPL